VHVVDGWEEGCELSLAMLRYGGLGHTLGLWAKDETVLDAWFLEKPANRIVVNGPTSEGAVGYSTNLMPAMSLGCGPMAGNITSDNISARHLINVKRVAFPRRDWETVYARGHERAAQWTGDRAPRGSGLPGDPGLGGGAGSRAPLTTAADASEPRSSWMGNPPVQPRAVAPMAAPRAASSLAPTPRFTEPRTATLAAPSSGSGGTQARSASAAAPRASTLPAAPAFSASGGSPRTSAAPPPISARPGGGPLVGMALTPTEIQGILAHAGAGCPLGPCRGCPHHDVRTGACTA
jgi:hypothetical protein